MTDYKKITKAELIKMLEMEKDSHAKTMSELIISVKDYQADQEKISTLEAEVFVLERTILRLNEEETVRQEAGE